MAKKQPAAKGEGRRNGLTPIGVASARCPAGKPRVEIPDGKGLYLVVQPRGTKTWVHRYAFEGKREKLTLGPALILGKDEREPEAEPVIGKAMTLAQAREVVAKNKRMLQRGLNPAQAIRAKKRATKTPPPANDIDLDPEAFENVALAFIQYYGASHFTKKGTKVRASTLRDTAGPLGLIDDGAGGYKVRADAFICPARAWRGRRIQEIRRVDAVKLMDAIVEARGAHAADNALAALRLVFNYAGDRELIVSSPLYEGRGVKRRMRPGKRKRTLVEDGRQGELQLVWQGAEEMGWPYGHLIRLLILTACRRDELAEARWSELRLGREKKTLELPGSRTKNGEPHSVPLSPQAVAILMDAAKYRLEGKPDWIFTLGTGRSKPREGQDAPLVPISGFSKFKSELDTRVTALAQKEADKVGVGLVEYLPAHWTQHDLRRTASTGMAKLGVPQEVIDRTTNHISGPSRQGVSDTYNTNPYTAEMRDALERWGEGVERIVRGEPLVPPKVVELKAGANA